MLRLLVLVLLLANSGYLAWSRGLLAEAGFAPAVQSEPQRLLQQIHPEAMKVLTTAEAKQLEAAAATPDPATSSPVECLQAGLFNETQTAALRIRLQNALPAGSWVLESSVEPARWMIYMGKYANADALEKKHGELRQLGVNFEPVNNLALKPGLSLGTFATQAESEAELARIAKRGVRTAQVIQERPEVRGQKLRLASVNAALKAQLDPIRDQLEGKTLETCR